jgi:hypothetical protein
MPRVLEQFAKRNLVPARWYSNVVAGAASELQIDIRVDGLDRQAAQFIARSLEALVNVQQVIVGRG